MKELMQHPRVLILDSGVGGLSIFEHLHSALNQATYIFCSDNAAFPYGNKEDAFILARVPELLQKLVDRYHPDVIIIACNTISTVALDALRMRFLIPVIGVVPAIKTAAQQSRSKVIGVLATPATVNRAYTHQLVTDFANDCLVLMHGSVALVEMAERKLRRQSLERDQLADELKQLIQQVPQGKFMDQIVLGCTHFPLLLDELKACPGAESITFVDSGAAIARRLLQVLPAIQWMHHAPLRNTAVFTDDQQDLALLMPALRLMGFEHFVKFD